MTMTLMMTQTREKEMKIMIKRVALWLTEIGSIVNNCDKARWSSNDTRESYRNKMRLYIPASWHLQNLEQPLLPIKSLTSDKIL